MQRYGKICTNTRKRTKKFTLSQFLARFFASITITTPLALGYHPEDARRVGDVLGLSSVLRCRYIYCYIPDISIVVYPIYLLYTRFIYCFCIRLVYAWYTFGIATLIKIPIPRTLSRVPPSFRKKSASISARA